MSNEAGRAVPGPSKSVQASALSGSEHFLDWLRAPPAPSGNGTDRQFIDFLSEDRDTGRAAGSSLF